jgi:acyl carrier protein
MTDVLPQVQRLAAEVFNRSASDITADSSPETVEEWDSIQHLSFIMALESSFDVEFSPEEMEHVRSVGDAAKLVATKARI